MIITSLSKEERSLVSDNDKPIGRKKYRSSNGNPRPYFDNNAKRFKAPAIIVLPNGEIKKTYGTGKRKIDAERKRDKNVQEILSVIKAENQDLSLIPDYCQHWLDNVKPSDDLKRKTRIGYQTAIDKHIRPVFSNIKVRNLRREDLQKLYSSMSKSGLSRSSINQVSSLLNQVFDEAFASGYVDINLPRTVKIPKRKKLTPIYFTYEETIEIKKTAVESGEWLIWSLALLLGLRQGERLGLRWSDVHLDGPEPKLVIRNSLTRISGIGLVLEDLKTESSSRDIPLPIEIVHMLKEHRRNQIELKLQLGEKWLHLDFVFTSSSGTAIDPANDRKSWVNLLKKAKVRYLKLHAARHTSATILLGLGNELLVISKILGHSSIHTTAEFYAHVQNTSKLAALISFGPELLGVK
jgi:integrase